MLKLWENVCGGSHDKRVSEISGVLVQEIGDMISSDKVVARATLENKVIIAEFVDSAIEFGVVIECKTIASVNLQQAFFLGPPRHVPLKYVYAFGFLRLLSGTMLASLLTTLYAG